MNILVSGCLLGLSCRYDGKEMSYPQVVKLLKQKNCHLIPVCPEQLGGLKTPRDPAELVEDRVLTCRGEDVTAAYEAGAREALKLAGLYHCRYAILKEKSPSCGCGSVYDGTFSRTLVSGNGKTAQLLLENGIEVVGEHQLDKLLERLLAEPQKT